MKTLNYIGQNGVIMRIEDGGGVRRSVFPTLRNTRATPHKDHL